MELGCQVAIGNYYQLWSTNSRLIRESAQSMDCPCPTVALQLSNSVTQEVAQHTQASNTRSSSALEKLIDCGRSKIGQHPVPGQESLTMPFLTCLFAPLGGQRDRQDSSVLQDPGVFELIEFLVIQGLALDLRGLQH